MASPTLHSLPVHPLSRFLPLELLPASRHHSPTLPCPCVGARTRTCATRFGARPHRDVEALRDGVRDCISDRLGLGGVLIIDDTGFIKKGITSAGGRQYTGASGKIDN
ncbi:transposase [Streptomyces sp. NPDC050988]|uniref:transposase n=1 Tax=Streptomyces sp. NPDC050988 TaxID=3365637 RepID=UPI00379F37BD